MKKEKLNFVKLFRYPNCQKGFTLVEVVVTAILFVMFSGVVLAILLTGTDSWQTNSMQLELQQDLREAVVWTMKDLRQAGVSTITDVPANGSAYDTITFRIAAGVSGGNISWSGNTIQFSRGGTNSRQLIRQEGGDTKVLANNLGSLSFTRQASTPNIVEVALVIEKNTPKNRTITLNSSFKVLLRN